MVVLYSRSNGADKIIPPCARSLRDACEDDKFSVEWGKYQTFSFIFDIAEMNLSETTAVCHAEKLPHTQIECNERCEQSEGRESLLTQCSA